MGFQTGFGFRPAGSRRCLRTLNDLETPLQLLEEAFVQSRDMDASLAERLQAFADAVRRFGPQFQKAVDDLVDRLKQHDIGENAPKPGDMMPNFVLPTKGVN